MQGVSEEFAGGEREKTGSVRVQECKSKKGMGARSVGRQEARVEVLRAEGALRMTGCGGGEMSRVRGKNPRGIHRTEACDGNRTSLRRLRWERRVIVWCRGG